MNITPFSTELGLCQCGCGNATPIARRSSTRDGTVKGRPLRYLTGHHARKSPVDYIVDADTGCWVWQRTISSTTGYGVVWPARGAHVVYYERYCGPVPPGLELDHLCRNRACVNPAHLEAVTHAVNMRRRVDAKLNEQKVREIRRLCEQGWRQRDIAKAHGISQTMVSRINCGIAWVGV